MAGGRALRRHVLTGPDGAWLPAVAQAQTQTRTQAEDPDAGGPGAAPADTSAGAGAPAASTLDDPPPPPARRSAPKKRLDAPLPINTCAAESLVLLPGVGPVLAERIARARAEGLRFGGPDDLRKVKGIGPKLAARLDSLVRYAP